MFSYDPQEPKYAGEKDQDGNPHGKGVMTFADGSTYEGEFFHG